MMILAYELLLLFPKCNMEKMDANCLSSFDLFKIEILSQFFNCIKVVKINNYLPYATILSLNQVLNLNQ